MESNNSGTSKSKRPTKSNEDKSSDSACGSDKGHSNKGPRGGKRLKKDDSGINVMPESDTSEDFSDSGTNSNYENKLSENSNKSDLNSPDLSNLESPSCSVTELKVSDNKDNFRTFENETSFISEDSDEELSQVKQKESLVNSDCDDSKRCKKSKFFQKQGNTGDSSDDDEDHVDEEKKTKEKEDEKYDPTPKTSRPIHRWSAPLAVLNRQYGSSCNYSPDLFRFNCYGSLHMVERLELMYKMKKHEGCVNALNFNQSGTKLVTGSDDLDVIIWDWTTSEPLLDYNSGHTSNVFQAKFMPFSGDCHVVTCARDGQVRIGELSTAGVCKGTRKLGQHRGAAHKLAIQKDNPHVFLSCAEDGHVFLFDLRVDQRKDNPQKLMVFMEDERRIPLYTIAINPQRPNEYVVGGRSPYVKIYDTRFTTEESACLKKFYPSHLVNREVRANVTSIVYNYNGEEILASYNEDIYLFSNYETESTKYLHRYRGHKNSQTIKGVNFFGPRSEFVVSGSDCDCIFFWDKESEHIVKYMHGDEMGVVNCIESHPNMPVLATSGLDDDIKIWVPSCEDEPDLSGLRDHVIANIKEQEEDSQRDCSDAFVDQTLLFLIEHLSRARSRQRPVLWRGTQESENSSTSDSEFQDDDDSDSRPALPCSQS